MALADAQVLATRKLLTKAAADSSLNPGPPLPKSHPAPALVAKLHLEACTIYSSARALAMTPSASKSKPRFNLKIGKDKGGEGAEEHDGSLSEVSGALRRYLSDAAALQGALAHKWLGVDAGDAKGSARSGEAVGWLIWARKELQELKDGGGVTIGGNEREKAMKERRKEEVAKELASVETFLGHYKKVNDSVSLQLPFFEGFFLLTTRVAEFSARATTI
jgi:hypothetical protein